MSNLTVIQMQKQWKSEFETKHKELTEIVTKVVGYQGRMIGGSKSGYCRRHPKNIPIFNANIVLRRYGKIWHGDLDLTVDEEVIKKAAKKLKMVIYVLREMDARFEHADKPRYEEAIMITDGISCILDPANYYRNKKGLLTYRR